MSIAEKINAIAENVEKVFEAGQRAGGGDGAFWDAFQDNGKRTDYQYAFCYGWTDAAFHPKHNITLNENGSRLMFFKTQITDIVGGLNGKELNCSKATTLYQTFESPNITSIPALDLSACTDLTLAFRYSQATTLTLNNLRPDCIFDRTFVGCTQLENLTITGDGTETGIIGVNGFSVSECKNLTVASLLNILSCLSADGAGKTVTLGSTNLEKLQDMMDSNGLPEGVTVTLENGAYKCKGWTLA